MQANVVRNIVLAPVVRPVRTGVKGMVDRVFSIWGSNAILLDVSDEIARLRANSGQVIIRLSGGTPSRPIAIRDEKGEMIGEFVTGSEFFSVAVDRVDEGMSISNVVGVTTRVY